MEWVSNCTKTHNAICLTCLKHKTIQTVLLLERNTQKGPERTSEVILSTTNFQGHWGSSRPLDHDFAITLAPLSISCAYSNNRRILQVQNCFFLLKIKYRNTQKSTHLIINRPHGVTVSTRDSESCDPSSNLRGTFIFKNLFCEI